MNFPMTSAQLNAMEQRATVPIATYESIKAKIDRGINRQSEGDKEVAEGLKEMISTKAYLKHYKSIAAFVENEYGKSKSWLYDRIKTHLPIEQSNISGIGQSILSSPASRLDKKESESLKRVEQAREEEPEKPHIRTATEVLAGNGEVKQKATDNGKPKWAMPVWRELEELFGRALNRIDEANHVWPDRAEHDGLIAATKECFARVERWHEKSR